MTSHENQQFFPNDKKYVKLENTKLKSPQKSRALVLGYLMMIRPIVNADSFKFHSVLRFDTWKFQIIVILPRPSQS